MRAIEERNRSQKEKSFKETEKKGKRKVNDFTMKTHEKINMFLNKKKYTKTKKRNYDITKKNNKK